MTLKDKITIYKTKLKGAWQVLSHQHTLLIDMDLREFSYEEKQELIQSIWRVVSFEMKYIKARRKDRMK